MDNYGYGIQGAIPSRLQTAVDFATVSEFTQKILDGTVTQFSLASFFQQNSDYITSINFFPIDVSKFIAGSVTQNNIVIGSKLAPTTNAVKQIVNWRNSIKFFSLNITRYHNNFLDFEPYTKFKVSVPYFGFIEIPLEYAYKGTIDCHIAVDFASGKATLYFYQGDILVTTKTSQLSISVPLGKTNAEEQDRNKVLHGIQAGISGGIIALGVSAGNPLLTGAGVSKAGAIITNAMNDSLIRLTSYDGGDGNLSMLAVDKKVMGIYEMPREIVLPNAHLVGRPCRQTLALSGLTGFTKVGDIHFEPNGEGIYQDEINEIVDLLHKGVIL